MCMYALSSLNVSQVFVICPNQQGHSAPLCQSLCSSTARLTASCSQYPTSKLHSAGAKHKKKKVKGCLVIYHFREHRTNLKVVGLDLSTMNWRERSSWVRTGSEANIFLNLSKTQLLISNSFWSGQSWLMVGWRNSYTCSSSCCSSGGAWPGSVLVVLMLARLFCHGQTEW